MPMKIKLVASLSPGREELNQLREADRMEEEHTIAYVWIP